MSIRPFALERFFAAHEFTAPHLLCASDCETVSIGELLELSGTDVDELLQLRLGYTESQGDPTLRAAIAERHGGVDPDHVLVTNAPEEAIFIAMHTLVRPGDRVVVMTPCYQSLLEVARHRGCDVVEWPVVETESGWRVDVETLQRLLEPGAQLVVINFPHNPTGCVASKAEFEAIAAATRRAGARLFSDEMYRGLERDPASAPPPAAALDDRAISLWGTSKSFGLPGLRIGWLLVPDRDALRELGAFKDYTTICSSAPGEFLARLALRHADILIGRSRERIDANTKLLGAVLDRHADFLAWRQPDGGPVAFARVQDGSADELCKRLRREAGVLLAPSSLFDHGDAHVRIGLGRAAGPAAIHALDAWLAARG